MEGPQTQCEICWWNIKGVLGLLGEGEQKCLAHFHFHLHFYFSLLVQLLHDKHFKIIFIHLVLGICAAD